MSVRQAGLAAVVVALLCGLAGFVAARSMAAPPLTVGQNIGDAPFTVEITGPPELIVRVKRWVAAGRGCERSDPRGMRGFSISWGDDKDGTMSSPVAAPIESGGCPGLLKHTYTVASAYTITARLFHIGPTDGTIDDWQGQAWVSVNGPQVPLSVELLSPVGGEVLTAPKGIEVRWKIATGLPTDLLVEVITPEGQPLFVQKLEDVAYNGEGKLWVPANLNPPLPFYTDGTAKVKLRLIALDRHNRVVEWYESGDFTLSER
jgi:hypothetical protein